MKNTKKPKGNKSYFAISDIHGCALELAMLIKELPLTANDEVIFLGDYVDRGEHSKDVVDFIVQFKESFSGKVIALKGNHEKMFLDFLRNADTPEAHSFIFNGGGATLASYADKTGEYVIPKNHIQFFDNLELFYETDKYLFVHAGLPDQEIKKLKSIPKEELELDLLWLREPFFESKFKWEKLIIHGHTCIPEIEITSKRINIDTACAYGGKLTALQLPEMKIYSIPKQEAPKMVVLNDPTQKKRSSMRYQGNISVKVHHNENYFNFVTVDYNEFGMLIHDQTEDGPQLFKIGQAIKGFIQPMKNEKGIPFEGTVLRIYEKSVGYLYALKFTVLPFDHID